MNSDYLDLAKSLQLEIATLVVNICKEHDINYFLMYGTLLGAIRHKGFIPWDDDLDLGMLRDDFNRFTEIFSSLAIEGYKIQTMKTDKYYRFHFIKIMKNDTVYLEGQHINQNKMNGIFIDIFPFDNTPNSDIFKKIHKTVGFSIIRLQEFKAGVIDLNKGSYIKRTIKKLINFFVALIPKAIIFNVGEFVYSCVKKETEFVTDFAGDYLLRRDWLKELTEIDFEGKKFLAPQKYAEVLETIYGNYMELPSIENRISHHHIIEFSVGEKVIFKNKRESTS